MQEPQHHPQSLSPEWLSAQLASRGRVLGLTVHDCIDSTSSWCLQQARLGRAMPFACLADQQTAGRGRHGRAWVSRPGSSILFSLACQPGLPLREIGVLSPAIGLALFNQFESMGVAGLQLKWPNDILVDGCKLAGILIETVARKDTLCAVIGIGINYDLGADDSTLSAIEQDWTDLCRCLPADELPGRNRVALDVLTACLDMVERLAGAQDEVMAEYSGRMLTYALEVSVEQYDGQSTRGTVLGVSRGGQLRLLDGGRERLFDSAEISMRKSGAAA